MLNQPNQKTQIALETKKTKTMLITTNGGLAREKAMHIALETKTNKTMNIAGGGALTAEKIKKNTYPIKNENK